MIDPYITESSEGTTPPLGTGVELVEKAASNLGFFHVYLAGNQPVFRMARWRTINRAFNKGDAK